MWVNFGIFIGRVKSRIYKMGIISEEIYFVNFNNKFGGRFFYWIVIFWLLLI